MKVYRCRICGAIRSVKGDLFVAKDPGGRARIRLHLAVAHGITNDHDKYIEEIEIENS